MGSPKLPSPLRLIGDGQIGKGSLALSLPCPGRRPWLWKALGNLHSLLGLRAMVLGAERRAAPTSLRTGIRIAKPGAGDHVTSLQ